MVAKIFVEHFYIVTHCYAALFSIKTCEIISCETALAKTTKNKIKSISDSESESKIKVRSR